VIADLFAQWSALPWVRALAVLIVGLAAVNIVGRLVQARMRRTTRAHWALVARRIVDAVGSFVVIVIAARMFGVNLTGLFATAGVATIAVGFAAQNSLANLIAGVFLLVDRPFEVGDTVEMEGRLGVVVEISVLSTLVRTFDNLLVRWPNEVVMKSTILNYTRHPVRRITLTFKAAYGTDVAAAREAVLRALREQPLLLLDPEPEVIARSLLDHAIEMEARVWARQQDFLRARTHAVQVCHDALRAAGVALGLPQVVVWPAPQDPPRTDR